MRSSTILCLAALVCAAVLGLGAAAPVRLRASGLRFKEVMKTAPAIPSLGQCKLLEEFEAYGCALDKFHGTVFNDMPVTDVKAAFDMFYVFLAELVGDGHQGQVEAFAKCLPSVKSLMCDAFVPRCTENCAPTKPCRARCTAAGQKCLGVDLTKMLASAILKGGAMRPKLKALVQEQTANKNVEIILDLAIESLTRCDGPAYSDNKATCLGEGKPEKGKTCFAPGETVLKPVTADEEDASLFTKGKQIPEPKPVLDQIDDHIDEKPSDATGSRVVMDFSNSTDAPEVVEPATGPGTAKDAGEKWVVDLSLLKLKTAEETPAVTEEPTGGETGSETGTATGGATGEEQAETGATAAQEAPADSGPAEEPVAAAPAPTVDLKAMAAFQSNMPAGILHIPMVAPETVGFKLGQTIQIGDGKEAEERVVVGLRGGVALETALSNAHELGTKIYLVKESTMAEEVVQSSSNASGEQFTPTSPYGHLTDSNGKEGAGHAAWIPGTALHTKLRGSSTGSSTGAGAVYVPKDLSDEELNYKPCPACNGKQSNATGGLPVQKGDSLTPATFDPREGREVGDGRLTPEEHAKLQAVIQAGKESGIADDTAAFQGPGKKPDGELNLDMSRMSKKHSKLEAMAKLPEVGQCVHVHDMSEVGGVNPLYLGTPSKTHSSVDIGTGLMFLKTVWPLAEKLGSAKVSPECLAKFKSFLTNAFMPPCTEGCQPQQMCRSTCQQLHADCVNADLKNILKELLPGGSMNNVVTQMTPSPAVVPVMETALGTILNCDTELVVDGETCIKEPVYGGGLCRGANAFDPSGPSEPVPEEKPSEPVPEEKPSEPVPEEKPKLCCKALNKKCMACAAGVTEEEFCDLPQNQGKYGCPGETPTKVKMCCLAQTKECMACKSGQTVKEFCNSPAHKGQFGCAGERTEAAPKCVELKLSSVTGCPASSFYGTMSVAHDADSVTKAMNKLYGVFPMLKMVVPDVTDQCLAVVKTEMCAVAFPSCSASCEERAACSSSVAKVKKECGMFASKAILGAILPAGTMESMAQSFLGKDTLPVVQDLVKLVLGEGKLDEDDKTCATSKSSVDACTLRLPTDGFPVPKRL